MKQIINNKLQIKRALTESDRLGYIPAIGEPVWSVEANTLYMGDGTTAGGVAVTGSDTDLQPIYNELDRLENTKADITNISAVGLSNDYNDLDNKPIIPSPQVNSDWNAVSGIAQILNKPSISTVGLSNDYNDLDNKPTIPTIPVNSVNGKTGNVIINKTDVGLGNVDNTSDLNKPISTATQNALNLKANTSSISAVGLSGNYSALIGLPIYTAGTPNVTIDYSNPQNVIISVSQSSVSVNWGDIGGDILSQIDLNNALDLKADNSILKTVAVTGDYNDLTNKPTIPAAQVNSDWNAASGIAQILNKPSISAVGLSNDYNDLDNKPSIPSVPVLSVNTKTGHVVLDKSDVGLGNVDNTSDLSKPISTATQNALNLKLNITDWDTWRQGTYQSDQLALWDELGDKLDYSAWVDFVDFFTPWHQTIQPIAYSGDFGDLVGVPPLVNSVNTMTGDVIITKATVGLGNVDNTSDLDKPISTLTQDALDLKVNIVDMAGVAFSGSYNDLLNKPTIPAAQVPSNWNATTGVSRILNKPSTLSGYGITDAINVSQKGVADGVVPLNQDGLIPNQYIPPLAITDTHIVNSEVVMLALTVQKGDLAIRTDISKSFINTTGTNGDISDWVEMLSPPNDVSSVNSKTGAVILDKSDIGLSNVDNTSDMNKPISTATQNALTLKANTTDISTVGLSNDYNDLDNKPTIPTIPVNSVNGKTGVVVINKSDVGLGNVDNTSDLSKPVSTATQSALNLKANTTDISAVGLSNDYNDLDNKPTIPTIPVNSVNGKTGNVIINKTDIGLSNVDNTSDLSKPVSTATQNALNLKANTSSISAVGLSNDYSDLDNKPVIPVQVNSDWNAVSGIAQILNKPSISAVGLSNNYNDLNNKPAPALPLTGGTITGDLVVEGTARARMASTIQSVNGTITNISNIANSIIKKTIGGNVTWTIGAGCVLDDTITIVNASDSGTITLDTTGSYKLYYMGEEATPFELPPRSSVTIIKISSLNWVIG